MTVDEVKELSYSETLIYLPTNKRWRVNGKVKTWKTNANRVEVPIKHGLYSFGYINEFNCGEFRKE